MSKIQSDHQFGGMIDSLAFQFAVKRRRALFMEPSSVGRYANPSI